MPSTLRVQVISARAIKKSKEGSDAFATVKFGDQRKKTLLSKVFEWRFEVDFIVTPVLFDGTLRHIMSLRNCRH